MAEKEIDLRRLVIKAFHMTDVEWGEHNNITTDGHMTVSKEMIDQLVAQDDCIEKIDIQIIKPGDHDRWTNTIMDIIPISTKVLGKLGEGITHTITGVYVMLTGVDVNGKQCHEFGSSEGNLLNTIILCNKLIDHLFADRHMAIRCDIIVLTPFHICHMKCFDHKAS